VLQENIFINYIRKAKVMKGECFMLNTLGGTKVRGGVVLYRGLDMCLIIVVKDKSLQLSG
jgi:hypothetical protein